MDDAERGVAFEFSIHNDAQCVKIIDLIEAFVVVVHFVVKRENGLDAPGQFKVDAVFGQFFRNAVLGVGKQIP